MSTYQTEFIHKTGFNKSQADKTLFALLVPELDYKQIFRNKQFDVMELLYPTANLKRNKTTRRIKYLILSILITFFLLILRLTEETSSEVRDCPGLPEEPEVSPELINIVSPADYDESGCPRVPISFSGMTGRLGNIISTYVNFIALQWKLGYKYHLPQHSDSTPDAWLTKSYLQNIFRNVSFPTANWSNWTKPRPKDAGPTGEVTYQEH